MMNSNTVVHSILYFYADKHAKNGNINISVQPSKQDLYSAFIVEIRRIGAEKRAKIPARFQSNQVTPGTHNNS